MCQCHSVWPEPHSEPSSVSDQRNEFGFKQHWYVFVVFKFISSVIMTSHDDIRWKQLFLETAVKNLPCLSKAAYCMSPPSLGPIVGCPVQRRTRWAIHYLTAETTCSLRLHARRLHLLVGLSSFAFAMLMLRRQLSSCSSHHQSRERGRVREGQKEKRKKKRQIKLQGK